MRMHNCIHLATKRSVSVKVGGGGGGGWGGGTATEVVPSRATGLTFVMAHFMLCRRSTAVQWLMCITNMTETYISCLTEWNKRVHTCICHCTTMISGMYIL